MRAVHLLRHEHAIITLCRVLNVNRSSYYKHFNSKEPKRTIENRNYPENVIFHSDRGSQYTSDEFRKRLDRASFIQSFSKKGHPYDNAVAEAFFKFLKLEETNRHSYTSFDELELSVFEYIHFYNFKRPHSANDLLSPVQFEALF